MLEKLIEEIDNNTKHEFKSDFIRHFYELNDAVENLSDVNIEDSSITASELSRLEFILSLSVIENSFIKLTELISKTNSFATKRRKIYIYTKRRF